MINLDIKEGTKIGIMFSGGVDSTMLLYLASIQAKEKNAEVLPFTIPRMTGALNYAYAIIDYFDYMFDIEVPETIIVGSTNEHHSVFVGYGIAEALTYGVDSIYTGSTKNPDIELEGAPHRFKYKYDKVKQPFLSLNKADIIKMYSDLDIMGLLKFTHSCCVEKLSRCGNCFFCKERAWAFGHLGLVDPGLT